MPLPVFVSSIGLMTATVSCTPGADLWVTPGGSAYVMLLWSYAGSCPESGSVVCGNQPIGGGAETITTRYVNNGWGYSSAYCYQDTRVIGSGSTGGGGGSPVTGEVTLAPFEFTAEQQLEVYQSLAVVFAAGLAALAAVWGVKQILKLLNTDTSRAD